jgi:hypothetical protein
MALKNFLSPNTYTNISNIYYEKNEKSCMAMLEIWQDETKKTLLAKKEVRISGIDRVLSVSSLVNKEKSPPAIQSTAISYIDGYTKIETPMGYIIADEAEGDFKEHEGKLARFNPMTQAWDKFKLWNNAVFYVEDEKKYYEFFSFKNEWVEVEVTNDFRLWNAWFSPELALSNGSNPMQQMYKFLKTQPQFKDCVDA